MSKHFDEKRKTRVIKNPPPHGRLCFHHTHLFHRRRHEDFSNHDYRLSGLFAALFAVKIVAKFIGVYFLAKKYIPTKAAYTQPC